VRRQSSARVQDCGPVHPDGVRPRSTAVKPWVLYAVLSLGLAARLHAHDPGLSTTQVELGAAGLRATIGFAPADLRALLPPGAHVPGASWSGQDFDSARPYLSVLAPKLVGASDDRGEIPWIEDSLSLASGNSVIFKLSGSRPPVGHLTLRPLVLDRLPPGHRDYISVSLESGDLLVEKLVGANDGPVSVALPAASAQAGGSQAVPESHPPTFWGFLRLGIAHIWTGYDHLLFLFGLLLVCRSFRSIIGIISCFTVAHSITLALATLGIVNLPSSLVEPMIAASIFYVGLENLARRGAEPKGRWALTFGFGLIHGFGFASALRELGIGSRGHGIAMPLLTFNLGVEIGQVSIAAIVLPIVWQLRKNPGFVRYGVPILSAIVALAGLYWFLQRTVFQAA
jgi:hydrogenase/urease accessory protein HupE